MEKNNERIYQEFERRNRQAELGGGEEKLRKRHEAGRMTARERIEMLLDKGTFVELDKFVTHRCTNYGMDRQKIPGDGIVSGYGKIDGRQVFVYAYDFTVFGGSLSITNANKIVKVQTMALKNGAPVIALNDSGGARIHDRFGCGAAVLGHSRAVRGRCVLLAGAYRFYLYGPGQKPYVRDRARRGEGRDARRGG